MIGRLRGVLAEVGEAECLIDCAGVGYVVSCGARTLGRLPAPGDEATVHVHSQWSEDAGPRLYGFLTRDERRAFTTLLAEDTARANDFAISVGPLHASFARQRYDRVALDALLAIAD